MLSIFSTTILLRIINAFAYNTLFVYIISLFAQYYRSKRDSLYAISQCMHYKKITYLVVRMCTMLSEVNATGCMK